jgi:phosphoribosylanthranilate isomerase
MPATAKICGITTDDALDAAIGGGASHVGFVFFPKSPRDIAPDRAAALAARAAGRVRIVGLFVDPDPRDVARVRSVLPLDVVQLHGNEPPALAAALRDGTQVWKAIPVRTTADLAATARYAAAADAILFDAKPPAGSTLPGGNGLRFDWHLLDGVRHPLPWILSGGLDPANVADAITVTGARIVDVSSGVESAPGVKSVDKIAAFLQSVGRS